MKKTWLLRSIALCSLLAAIGLICMDILYLEIPNLWFYSFCLCIGIYELAKAFLFRFDSALYFGTLMASLGANGYIFYLHGFRHYAVFFIVLSFIAASLVTFIVCHQRFHLILAYSISFVGIYGFLLTKSLITPPIFIAIVALFLIQCTVSIILNIKKGI